MKKLNKITFFFVFVAVLFISLGFVGVQKSYAQTGMYRGSYYNGCGEGGCNYVYGSSYSYGNSQQSNYYNSQQPSYYSNSQQQPSYYNPSPCGEGGCNYVYGSSYSYNNSSYHLPYPSYNSFNGNYY